MMRRITDWLLGRSPTVTADPRETVSEVVKRTIDDLSKLSDSDPDIIEAHEIICRALTERTGGHSNPNPILEARVRELSDVDYLILRYYKQGKSHSAIAESMGTDVATVRRSLIKTYSDLRMAMSEHSAAA